MYHRFETRKEFAAVLTFLCLMVYHVIPFYPHLNMVRRNH